MLAANQGHEEEDIGIGRVFERFHLGWRNWVWMGQQLLMMDERTWLMVGFVIT